MYNKSLVWSTVMSRRLVDQDLCRLVDQDLCLHTNFRPYLCKNLHNTRNMYFGTLQSNLDVVKDCSLQQSNLDVVN